MGKSFKPVGLSRRSFLKTTGAVFGAAAVGGLSACSASSDGRGGSAEVANEIEGSLLCHHNCHGSCVWKGKVREGKLVETVPMEWPVADYNRGCVRGYTHPQRMYADSRVQYPMKRVDGAERGAGEWERISWDEAEALIAEKWRGYIDQYGISSIGFYAYGGNMNTSMWQYSAFQTMTGVTVIDSQMDRGSVFGGGNSVGAVNPVYSGGCGNWLPDIKKAKNIFILSGEYVVSEVNNVHLVLDAKRNGGKVVVIDPVCSLTVSRLADVHVPLRAGTDACLYMGMMHVALEENLVDVDFVRDYTVAPYLVKKSDGLFLRQEDLTGAKLDVAGEGPAMQDMTKGGGAAGGGAALTYDTLLVMGQDGEVGLESEVDDPVIRGSFTVQGIEVTTAYDLLLARLDEYPLSLCAEICDVSEDLIREITRIYADGPTTALSYLGNDHYNNSYQAHESSALLAAMLGQMFKEGATYVNHTIGVLPGGTDAFLNFMVDHDARSDVEEGGKHITSMDLADVLESGKFLTGEDCNLKSLYITMSNPVANWVDRQHTLKVFDMLDFIVVSEIEWSETAQHADLVLPACYRGEFEDFGVGGSGAGAGYTFGDQLVDAPCEARPDIEHFNMLYRVLGMDDCVMSQDEWMHMAFEDSETLAGLGITYDRLKKEKIIQCFDDHPNAWPKIAQSYPTKTGREQFYLEAPQSNASHPVEFDADFVRLPHWFPPFEAWTVSAGGYGPSEASAKYPIHISYVRSRYAAHSSFAFVPWLNELDGDPYIRMNPEDALARGIANDDLVRIFNDRGYVVCKVRIDGGMRPGMVVTPERWQGSQFVKGNMNDLSSRAHGAYFENSSFKDVLVEIEKYEEA